MRRISRSTSSHAKNQTRFLTRVRHAPRLAIARSHRHRTGHRTHDDGTRTSRLLSCHRKVERAYCRSTVIAPCILGSSAVRLRALSFARSSCTSAHHNTSLSRALTVTSLIGFARLLYEERSMATKLIRNRPLLCGHRWQSARRCSPRAPPRPATSARGGGTTFGDCAIDVCAACGYTAPSYNSCRNRHCPSAR
jgi:hypothetical protein